jgi:hypothetical protein
MARSSRVHFTGGATMDYQTTRLQRSERSLAKGRSFERRKAPRHAILHAHGQLQCVDMTDISREGVKLDRAFGVKAGDPVTVELLSRRTLNGTVAWSVAAFCGIEFDQPLAENDPALAAA